MIIRRAFSSFAFAITLLGSTTLQALADPLQDLRAVYVDMQRDFGEQNLLNVIAQSFQQFDRDGDGLEKEEIDSAEAIHIAQFRSRYASQWLMSDLNGDARVSREELGDIFRRQRFRTTRMNDFQKKRLDQELEDYLAEAMQADKDSNGVIEGVELYLPQRKEQLNARDEIDRHNPTRFARAMVAADPNADGVLTESEAAGFLATALAGVEEDIKKKIAEEEQRRALGISENCKPLNVPKDGLFTVVGAHAGKAISTATVSGQDEETSTAGIEVEQGTEPLTLMLNHRAPMIWRISGATQRITKVIVAGPATRKEPDKVRSGIVGVPANKIEFLALDGCIRDFDDPADREGLMAKAILTKLAGREPSQMLRKYGVQDFKIPSGEGLEDKHENSDEGLRVVSGNKVYTFTRDGKLSSTTPLNSADVLQNELLMQSPGGIVEIKPTDVVTGNKVEAYETYPKMAGLLQLQKAGKIETMKGGGWKVKAKMRFPSGLHGGHSTKFFVPKGIPIPDGDPGHSCVFIEETASSMGNRSC